MQTTGRERGEPDIRRRRFRGGQRSCSVAVLFVRWDLLAASQETRSPGAVASGKNGTGPGVSKNTSRLIAIRTVESGMATTG